MRKPCLVVMAGLPGTGKSALSRELCARLDGALFDKDLVRAALFSGRWLEYSREQDDLCLSLMLQAAAYLIQSSSPPPFVFIDGRTFSRAYQIERVLACAAELACPAKIIHLTCSDSTARERLSQPHVAANRDFALYLEVKKDFEPIERPSLTLNTDNGLTHPLLARAIDYLRSESP